MTRAPLLTKAEVADWLRVSVRTLDRLVAQGAIAPLIIGGQVRFCPDEISRFLKRAKSNRSKAQGKPS
jgi:excisionase family DNA binding protein